METRQARAVVGTATTAAQITANTIGLFCISGTIHVQNPLATLISPITGRRFDPEAVKPVRYRVTGFGPIADRQVLVGTVPKLKVGFQAGR